MTNLPFDIWTLIVWYDPTCWTSLGRVIRGIYDYLLENQDEGKKHFSKPVMKKSVMFHILPNGWKHGYYQEYHFDSEDIRIKCFYIDNKINGLYEAFYSNGQLYKRVNYTDGKRNGLYESWWANGQMFRRFHYISGEKNGLYESWYKDGRIRKKICYVNGVVK